MPGHRHGSTTWARRRHSFHFPQDRRRPCHDDCFDRARATAFGEKLVETGASDGREHGVGKCRGEFTEGRAQGRHGDARYVRKAEILTHATGRLSPRLDGHQWLNKRIPMELTLGVRVLMRELEALARQKGFLHARVQSKVNARGELVLGVIIPARTPGEWGRPPELADREAKRRAREQS